MTSGFRSSSLPGSDTRLPDPDLAPTGQVTGLQAVGRALASGRGAAQVMPDHVQPDPGTVSHAGETDYRRIVRND